VPEQETDDSIRAYNEYQSSWFGLCESYKASLTFYFSPAIVDSFAHVIQMTETMDAVAWDIRSPDGAKKAYEAGLAVYESLRAWNIQVMGQIKGKSA
jgi:hypothetical protein